MTRSLKLTFKPTEEWILDEIEKHSGKGNWVKDVLVEHINGEGKRKTQTLKIEDDFSIFDK